MCSWDLSRQSRITWRVKYTDQTFHWVVNNTTMQPPASECYQQFTIMLSCWCITMYAMVITLRWSRYLTYLSNCQPFPFVAYWVMSMSFGIEQNFHFRLLRKILNGENFTCSLSTDKLWLVYVNVIFCYRQHSNEKKKGSMSKLHSRNIKWLSTVLHLVSSQYRGMAVNGLRPGLLTQDHFKWMTQENTVGGSNVYTQCVVASIKIPKSRCDLP